MSLKDQLVYQYKLSANSLRDELAIKEFLNKVNNLFGFKLYNCKYCVNKVCILLKKNCLFYDKVTGYNFNFFKCKYFKRTYVKVEDAEKVQKAFKNLLTNIYLPKIDKDSIELTIEKFNVSLKYEGDKLSYNMEKDSYNNILSEIKQHLIEKFGFYKDGMKILQLNNYQIKYEYKDEIFIYNVRASASEEFYNIVNNSSVETIVSYIKDNFKFEKSSKLMNISKEMKMLYDTVHNYNLILETFDIVDQFTLSFSTSKNYENSLIVKGKKEELTLYGLKLGGTITEVYYLSSLLLRFGFYFKVSDLLLQIDVPEYKVIFYKDKSPKYIKPEETKDDTSG